MLQNVEVDSGDEQESAKAQECEHLGKRIGCLGTLHLGVAYLKASEISLTSTMTAPIAECLFLKQKTVFGDNCFVSAQCLRRVFNIASTIFLI